ncbi:hypothetical protein ACQKM1_22195 [Peribacillus frigoritolerans]|uniref:hypothetical protein n=1 Tax=Peribacillus frigoritolerans TaxID=450367 RepID=UPI003D08B8CB
MVKKKFELCLDVLILAKLGFESLTEEEIQEWYGSDYYAELKKFLYQGEARRLLNDI